MEIQPRQEEELPPGPMAPTLARLAEANRALAAASRFDDIKEIRDKVGAIEDYLRRQKAATAAVQLAMRIRLRAEWRLGDLLRAMPKNKGARGVGVRFHDETAPTYAQLGIEKVAAHRWQQLAELTAEELEQRIDLAISEGHRLAYCRVVKEAQKSRQPEPPPTPRLPAGVFEVIYADPPWQTDLRRGTERDVENHYPTMPLEAICQLPVPQVAAADCVLFLWATSPMLPQAFQVMQAWGFAYKTCAVWEKSGLGMGYYFRQNHELLLVGTRGAPGSPAPEDRPGSVIHAPKGRHSEKPAVFRQIIEHMYPERRKVELFCREPVPGWVAWGNEVPQEGEAA
jgi:N6-adenosine-specific RNA methylase IME4